MSTIAHFYEQFQPSHYDLFLNINRAQKSIQGKTTITGHAQQPAIQIHQKDLTINSVQVADKDVPFSTNNEEDAINISLPQAGDVSLTIEYSTTLTDSMMGIYPSYYKINGETKQIIGTQFETTFARQAFPCVDEPEAKATFSLAIKYDEHPGETIIANMPEDHEAEGVHYFQPTVRMSTYLVAFAFGELQAKKATTKSGVEVGVFATKAHQAKELDFGLEIATKAIEFYEDFYHTPYPLPHSWQLALPDFSAGAMENWGLVTYREAYLLLDPDNTSLDMKRLVATVITHELAHQWFGDLVTMKWWDDLWLNESFANMMEYVAVDAIHPEWKIWELFQTSEAPMALQRDATDGVQPVHVQVHNPAEIDAIFDSAIVYAKGSRMLVMVRSLIGDDALRTGLKNYFAAHQYHNATGADLWSALGAASHLDIGAIMESWLEQPGYPVLTAKIENDHLKLHQEQFFVGAGEDHGRLWQLPLNANFADAPQIMKTADLDLGNYEKLRSSAGQPLRFNVGNNAHFIVNYDQTLLNDIIQHLDELDHIAQRQLLQDLRLLADSGDISYAELVPLLPRFANSHSEIVNTALYAIVKRLKWFVQPESKEEAQLKRLVDQLTRDQVSRLGWLPQATDSNDDQLTRPIVLSAALYANNQEAIEAAHQLFITHQKHLEQLPADIRPLVLANEMKHYGGPELFNQLLQAYQDTTDASYKGDLNGAITSAKNPKLLHQLINDFEDSTIIKPQDLRGWYRNVLANRNGQQAAWEWLRAEWDWLNKTVGGDMEFATFITVTANVFRTPERLTEFKEFFTPKINTPGLTREITMDIKMIEAKVALIQKEQTAVHAAIEQSIM